MSRRLRVGEAWCEVLGVGETLLVRRGDRMESVGLLGGLREGWWEASGDVARSG